MRKPLRWITVRDEKRGRRRHVPVFQHSSRKSYQVVPVPPPSDGYSPPLVNALKPKGLALARQLHERRSDRAQKIDETLEARITNDVEKWSRMPNRWDIRGVDQFPVPTMKEDFVTNCKILAYSMEQYYDKPLNRVAFFGHNSENSFRHPGMSSHAYAYVRMLSDGSKEVHFGPQATALISKGRIDSPDEYFAFNSIVHELGHVVGRMPTQSAFEEGSNELLSQRYTLNSIKMPRDLRKRLREVEPRTSYPYEVKMVGDTALLVNGGDPERAVQWLEGLRKKPANQSMPMVMEAIEELKKFTEYYEDYRIHSPFGLAATSYAGFSPSVMKSTIESLENALRQAYPQSYDLTRQYRAWWALY